MRKLENFNEEDLAVNPFVVSLRIPVTKAEDHSKFKVKMEDGMRYPATYLIERTPHVRIFNAPHNKESIFNLSSKATRLFLYIIFTTKPNKDYVQLNQDDFKKKLGVSSDNTFLDAKKELIRYGFIASTQYKTVFWINPNIFFPGNRLVKYPTNIDVTHKK